MSAPSARSRTPEPGIVVHVKEVQRFDPPQKWIHQEHYLTLLLRGEGYYRTGPQALPAERPLICLLPAGDDDVDGFTGPVEAWYVGFRWPGLRMRWAGKAALDVAWCGRSVRLPRYKLPDAEAATRLVEAYERLRRAFARQDLSGLVRARAVLMELFTMYADLPDDPDQPTANRALVRFHELLLAKAGEAVSIEQLAEEAGLTANHLRELFRRRFGQRPVEYRTGLRLARARDLLASTRMNVKEVAHRMGYPDPLYFSRLFKGKFGLSPREIIRRYRLAPPKLGQQSKKTT